MLLLSTCASVHAQQVRGVNPADIDSRFDVIVKHVALHPEGKADSITFKYDYKLNQNWGLNFELPVLTQVSVPGASSTGNGDLFARARWITPAGPWTYGASAEAVFPGASKDALGTGKYQLNFAGLLVRPLSERVIIAGALKRVTSVGGDRDRPDFSNTEIRLVPVLILQHGWAITGELRQTWEHRSDLSWQRIEAVVNKQFSAKWAGSVGWGRDVGDRKDGGAVSVSAKYFF